MRVAFAETENTESLVDLLHELHRYYNNTSTVQRTTVREHVLGNLLTAESPIRLVVAANSAGNVIGFAAVVFLHSLVKPEPEKCAQCLIKELFVSETQRSQGVGHALMAWVARYAAAKGCSRVDWNLKVINSHGIAFYERLGAERIGDRLSYRLSAAGIANLSNTDGGSIDADPHYAARGMLQAVQMDDGSELAMPGFVPKLSATPGSHRRNAPALGQDTDAVLREIGLNEVQISKLRHRGIVG